jgi:hypothetical protein
MVKSLADILELFIIKEQELLKKYQIIRHPVLIGEMYEGITKDVLAQIILPNLDLRVVSGMILTTDNILSKQIDCMLVIGDGNKIPHTNNYIYSIDNVIAVVEVKKNLFTNNLEDAFVNLNSFCRWVEYENLSHLEIALISNAFRTIFYGIKIHTDFKDQTITERMTYLNIIMDATNPLKFVFAYDGFKTENKLRTSLLNLIEKNVGIGGFQPFNFPDLIICKNNAILKANGIPYGLPFSLTGIWPFICSCDQNPINILISQIWYRLIHRFNLSHDEVIGEKFFSIKTKPLVGTIYDINNEGNEGWTYYNTDEKLGFYHYDDAPFVLIDNLQFMIILRLFKEPFIDCENDMEIREILNINSMIVSVFVQQMLLTEVVKLDGSKIMLINKENTGVFKINERIYAFLGSKVAMDWIINKLEGKKIPFLKIT